MSVRVSYKKQFLLGIILLVIIILVLEGLAIASLYFYNYCLVGQRGFYKNLDIYHLNRLCLDNSLVDIGYIPNLYLAPNEHLRSVNIDNEGFRGPDISKVKPQDTYRIFVVGGSTTFGLFSTSDDTTISGYLQKDFDNANLSRRVEVINAGIPSAFSYTEIRYIKEQLLDYQPDLTIVYDGYNDLVRDYQYYNTTLGGRTVELDVALAIERSLPFVELQYAASNILAEIKHQTSADKTLPFDSRNIDRKSAIWADRWKEICELGKEKGFDTIVTLQPIPGTGNRTMTPLEHSLFVYNNGQNKLDAYRSYAAKLNELKNYCVARDLRNTFDTISGRSVYLDRVHVSDEGNKIIADKLFGISLPIVKQKVS